MPRTVLILGGARSGKSSFALREASLVPGQKAFVATAEALDDEMEKRINNHRNERDRNGRPSRNRWRSLPSLGRWGPLMESFSSTV
jgi:adenosyl cobinamide kinase/adenosyl cobinamide phosphate guanylyltransferase